ncbi:MAG: flagellar type III secretion system protein FlhB, partial [Rhodospirillaceae bacterium]|nr:flagellar type III secretion system protein FlhB [Rhodospirillaceae bacterium]
AKNLAKLGIVGTLAYLLLVPKAKTLDLLVTMELRPTLDYLHSILLTLLLFVVALVATIGLIDWIFQRYQYLKKMRMTKQEIKDEYKQNEGDPMIRSRLRAIRMARTRQRMMAAVPEADVVVTNPTHYACALKYDPEKMNAPVLVAKGQDLIAARIRDVARDHDVPIVENPPLARALHASVEIDDEIHPDHYKAVAEVISYVMRLKEKKFRRR